MYQYTHETLCKDLLAQCYRIAKNSPHPSTHVGAIIINKKNEILVSGINTFPCGIKNLPERIEGENKHIYLNHAERDAIYNAAKKGISTNNCTMIMPWIPCIQCANAIISSGIKRLITHKQMIHRTKKEWKEELHEAQLLLHEANIEIIAYDGIIGETGYMHGEYWNA